MPFFKESPACESCLMPLNKDPGTRESNRYCSLCFRDGKLCYEGSNLKEFQNAAYEGMLARGMNKYLAVLYAWMIRFAPRWKK